MRVELARRRQPHPRGGRRARLGAHRHDDAGPLRPRHQLYDTWRQHTLAGTKIPSPDRETIASFIEPVFGLPDEPKSEDHLHGHVGEWLWHLLTKDNAAVRVQPDPKGDVTDAGADGFSIYENTTGALRFRLWESKKNTGSGSLSTSLNQAYTPDRDLRPALRRQDRRHLHAGLERHLREHARLHRRGARRVDPR